MSRDPIEEDGGYNLYGFIDNNPVDYWDELGLMVMVMFETTTAPIPWWWKITLPIVKPKVRPIWLPKVKPIWLPTTTPGPMPIPIVDPKIVENPPENQFPKEEQGKCQECDKSSKKGKAKGERNPAQDKKLTDQDIKDLEKAGYDIHDLKGGKNASKYDLYKDTKGNIYVKPKRGRGPGDPKGINLKNLNKIPTSTPIPKPKFPPEQLIWA